MTQYEYLIEDISSTNLHAYLRDKGKEGWHMAAGHYESGRYKFLAQFDMWDIDPGTWRIILERPILHTKLQHPLLVLENTDTPSKSTPCAIPGTSKQ